MLARSCPSLSPMTRGHPWAALIFRGFAQGLYTAAGRAGWSQPTHLLRSPVVQVAVTWCPWLGTRVWVPHGGQVPANCAEPWESHHSLGKQPHWKEIPGKWGFLLSILFFKACFVASTDLIFIHFHRLFYLLIPADPAGAGAPPDVAATLWLEQPSPPKPSWPRTFPGPY